MERDNEVHDVEELELESSCSEDLESKINAAPPGDGKDIEEFTHHPFGPETYIIIAFGLGMVVGLLSFAKVLSFTFKKYIPFYTLLNRVVVFAERFRLTGIYHLYYKCIRG